MKILLIYTGLSVLSFYFLGVYYLAVMNLKRVNHISPLTGATKIAGLTVLYPGLLLDAIVNIFVMTFVFIEIPREFLVTARLSRHVTKSSGWRHKLAAYICSTLLDKFDPSGCHCK